MTVIPRGQSFQATINHKGKRYRRQFPTHLEAVTWELAAKLALSKGEEPDMGNTTTKSGDYKPSTFNELAEYMIEHRWKGTKAEKTAKLNMQHMVRVIGPDTEIAKITTHTINLAIAQLREGGYPQVTINKKMSTIRVCMRYAMDQGWITRMPGIQFIKGGEGRLRFFTLEEENEMLAYAKGQMLDELWDYIVVSLDTGLRQGETLTLKARNIADKRVTIWGQRTATDNGTKAGTTRVIPLTERAAEVLERRAELYPAQLFPYTKDQITHLWNRMRDALGHTDDREYVPHAMRHTFVSRLVKRDVNLAVVQKLAGHLRIETTLRYTHLDDDVLVKAIARLEERKEQDYAGDPSGTLHPAHATQPRHKDDVSQSKMLN